MTDRAASRHQASQRPVGGTTRRLLWWCFALQAMIGAAIVYEGSRGLLPSPLFAPRTPAMEPGVPVSPDDQRRRYRPADLPGSPLPHTAPRPGEAPGMDSLDLPPMPETLQVRLAEEGDRTVLRLTGAIDVEAAERVDRALARAEAPPQEVVLHSPGGVVIAALEIGRAVRAAGLPTRMEPGAVCLSACPYMLAGGTERRVSDRAAVGVHQSYYDSAAYLPLFIGVSDVQRGEADAMRFLMEMGVDPLVRIPALETPPNDIYLLTGEELLAYRLATDLIGEGD